MSSCLSPTSSLERQCQGSREIRTTEVGISLSLLSREAAERVASLFERCRSVGRGLANVSVTMVYLIQMG